MGNLQYAVCVVLYNGERETVELAVHLSLVRVRVSTHPSQENAGGQLQPCTTIWEGEGI